MLACLIIIAILLLGTSLWLVFLLDQRKSISQQLESASHFERMVDEASTYIYTTDVKGYFTYINPAAARRLGLPAERLVGQHFNTFIAPAYRSRIEAVLMRQVQQKQIRNSYQFPVVTRDGEEVWLEQISQLVCDDQGDPSSIRVMSRDITSTREKLSELQDRQRQIQGEISAAKAVHNALLPATLPSIQGLDIGLVFQAADELGGDYVEFLPSKSPKQLEVMFADITGHGIASALLSSMMKVLVSEARSSTSEPEEVMSQLNARIQKEFPNGKFASAVLLEVDMQERSLKYIKASQEPIIHYRPGEGIQLIEAGGPALGLVAPAFLGDRRPYAPQSMQLHPGDTLILYTDGLIELEDINEEQIGRQKLLSWIEEGAHLPAQELADTLYCQALNTSASGTADDDITILVIGVR